MCKVSVNYDGPGECALSFKENYIKMISLVTIFPGP